MKLRKRARSGHSGEFMKQHDDPRGKLDPRKKADKSWYLSLLDGEEQ